MPPEIAVILLAAGESTRMGRLKQLLPWGGSTLLEWQVEQMRRAGVDDVIVVLGHEAKSIRQAIGSIQARFVINDAYQEGRASSVRRGAEAIAEGTQAVLILGVDQPRPSWVSDALIEHWRQNPAPLVIPTFDGRRDHPLLLDGSLRPELLAVTEEGLGLRQIRDRHGAEAHLVPIANEAVRVDLNTLEDYEKALASYEAGAWAENVAKV